MGTLAPQDDHTEAAPLADAQADACEDFDDDEDQCFDPDTYPVPDWLVKDWDALHPELEIADPPGDSAE